MGAAGFPININGGTLSGPGTVNGNLTNAGEVDLGTAVGRLTVSGNYNQSGVLSVKVGGTTAASQYDQVAVSGQASLGGTLNVSLINGFGPAVPETFAALSASGVTGSFAATNLPSIDGQAAFSVQTTATTVNLNAIINSPDLSVAGSSIVVPGGMGTPGQNITVNYTVANLSPAAATGSWTDSVYLSPDGTVNANDLLLGRVTHTGGLARMSSYNGTLTAPLPGVVNGSYYVIVTTDSQLQVPDVSRANNTGVSAPLPVRAGQILTLGTAVSGTIASGQDLYYEVDVTPGKNVQLGESFGAAHQRKIFASRFTIPTPSSFNETDVNGGVQQPILLPDTQGGLYYILVQGQQGRHRPGVHTGRAGLAAPDPELHIRAGDHPGSDEHQPDRSRVLAADDGPTRRHKPGRNLLPRGEGHFRPRLESGLRRVRPRGDPTRTVFRPGTRLWADGPGRHVVLQLSNCPGCFRRCQALRPARGPR